MLNLKNQVLTTILLVLCLLSPAMAGKEPIPTLFWLTNNNAIISAPTKSSGLESTLLVPEIQDATINDITAHPTEPILYISYTNNLESNIASHNYETKETKVRLMLSSMSNPKALDIEYHDNFVYFLAGSGPYSISKVHVDNGVIANVLSDIDIPRFTIDRINQKIFVATLEPISQKYPVSSVSINGGTPDLPYVYLSSAGATMDFLPGVTYKLIFFDPVIDQENSQDTFPQSVVTEGNGARTLNDIGTLTVSLVPDLVVDTIGREVFIAHSEGMTISTINIATNETSTFRSFTEPTIRKMAFSNNFTDNFGNDGGDSGGDGSGGDNGGGSGDDGSCTDFSDADGDQTPRCEAGCTVTASNDCILDECPNHKGAIEERCGCDVDTIINEQFLKDNETACSTVDECPDVDERIVAGVCGCEGPLLDSIPEGVDPVEACKDSCPNDSNKTKPGICLCGVLDTILDENGDIDCYDECPYDHNKQFEGICGCFVPDNDTDGDGVADCIDGCPKNASRTEPGPCGCSGSAETKLDGTVTCKVKFEVPTKSKEGKKIINPLTGEQLVPDPAKLELESTCCGAALEFPGYKFVNDTKVVLAAKRKSKKSSLKVKYEVTLNELTSKKTKTTKRNTGRQRLSLGKLKPGTNYIVSYKLQGTKNSNNGKERVVASSASSKSISFRTPQ